MQMDDLMSELLPIYIGELHEHVKLVVQELLALEKRPDEAARVVLFESILRTLHSLKGASRSMGLATAASVCHEMETILLSGREGSPLDTSDFQILFKALDAIEAMGQLLQTGDNNAERQVAPLLFSLKEHRIKLQSVGTEYLPEGREEDILTKSTDRSTDESMIESTSEPDFSPSNRAKIIENSVRLPVAKLDMLLAEGLDLVTITNRNAACLEGITQLHRKVTKWEREIKQENKNNVAEMDRMRALSKQLDQIRFTLRNENRLLASAVSQVAGGINGLRMVPIGQACQGMDRMVRDLALSGHKQIQLKFSGMEVEVDRNVLEQIKDPLMHLVRNACDHGAESTEERLKCGKPAKSTIKIEASLLGSQAQIAVSDDGRGISFDAVCARAKKLSLPLPESETEMKHLLFSKGFSTSPIITEISGRGIGLDVVKDKIEGLHGAVDLETREQRGSTFLITVPLTLTNMRALFVRAGGQLFAIATSSIQKLLRILPEDFNTMEGQTVLPMGDLPLPVMTLSQILDLPPSPVHETKIPAVVLYSG
jgi:two-component system chemotaxis sensor kinase CheA